MNKKWQICEVDKEKVEKLKSKYGISELLATILVNKNITTQKEIEEFLNPTRNDFFDPFLINDMDIAVERIRKAIETQEKVIIYGDYDVDGITSITVLKSFLKDVGLDVDYYIPNRLEEGYGLNKNAIDEIAKNKYTLMITVDCGISAIEEVNYANSLGIEVIVTDHHEPGEELPKALAVIDNKRKDSKYPFRELAGVGVAFKVSQALAQSMNVKEEEYLKYLDIVCVGTISDIVPLISENRVITKLGIKLLKQTRNTGLKAIINSSGYSQINSTTISFGVAPRINACGRMGKAEQALKLLLSKDIYEVNKLTQELNNYNRERQEIEKEIFESVLNKIEQNNLDKNRTIVVGGEGWHHGVIGIVSSKITEKYFKPSILLSFEEDGTGKGSGRSIPGFDLHEALMKCENCLEKFGGHSMAVGLTLKKDKFEQFYEEFEKVAKENKTENIVPIINVDAKIELNEIDKTVVEDLKQLEPFGEANKMPVFALKNIRIDSIRALSEGKHLKLTLRDNNQIINAIGFNIGELANEYKIGDKVDLAGVLEINTFNGIDNLQINIKDIMKSI
ncbi:MAG: single-stranded-DNA-specific exonuclease RecJ [Clostridiales bacterium]|nr:single-stranded-DNA-specific exonuclease RecJ [Clostridiales bacterium]